MTGTPQLLLVHHLKTLKLPAFLREYDKLARQCAAEGAGHVRHPVRLAELELIDRERRMVERRIRQARFPAVKSLDSFDHPVPGPLTRRHKAPHGAWRVVAAAARARDSSAAGAKAHGAFNERDQKLTIVP